MKKRLKKKIQKKNRQRLIEVANKITDFIRTTIIDFDNLVEEDFTVTIGNAIVNVRKAE